MLMKRLARAPQLHCPLMLLAVLPPPLSRSVLPWHTRLPRALLSTTSTGPVLSSTDMFPPTELSNISAELVLPETPRLPPIALPGQISGSYGPIWTAAALLSIVILPPTVVQHTELLALPDGRPWIATLPPILAVPSVKVPALIVRLPTTFAPPSTKLPPVILTLPVMATTDELAVLTGGDSHIAGKFTVTYPLHAVPEGGAACAPGTGTLTLMLLPGDIVDPSTDGRPVN
jgi:hypothetical protein